MPRADPFLRLAKLLGGRKTGSREVSSAMPYTIDTLANHLV